MPREMLPLFRPQTTEHRATLRTTGKPIQITYKKNACHSAIGRRFTILWPIGLAGNRGRWAPIARLHSFLKFFGAGQVLKLSGRFQPFNKAGPVLFFLI